MFSRRFYRPHGKRRRRAGGRLAFCQTSLLIAREAIAPITNPQPARQFMRKPPEAAHFIRRWRRSLTFGFVNRSQATRVDPVMNSSFFFFAAVASHSKFFLYIRWNVSRPAAVREDSRFQRSSQFHGCVELIAAARVGEIPQRILAVEFH